MNVNINRNVTDLSTRMVEYYSDSELREYDALNPFEKDDILKETYKRGFLAYWNAPNRPTLFERSDEGKEEQQVFRVASRVKGAFCADINFEFDYYSDKFKVDWIAKEADETQNNYSDAFNQEMEEVKACMEKSYDESNFIRDFFRVLHARRLTMVTSNEAVAMYSIYQNAMDVFPDFKRLTYSARLQNMHKAYMRGRIRNHTTRDIYTFAKATFEEFDDDDLISKVIAYNPIAGMVKNYRKVYERRITRVNPSRPSEVWEYNYLVYATYEYTTKTGEKVRISFHPSELWSFLHREGMGWCV